MTDDGPVRGDDAIDPWEHVAAEWDRDRERLFNGFRTTSDWLIDAIDPRPGQTVLEVAAGPGETGFLVAERVRPDGRVISTDLAPTMVEAARRGAAARGLANVECRVMDAQRLDLDDATVDAVLSRLGLMLVPDPRAALREIRRVLRPTGRVAYAVMGPPDRNQWMSLVMGALMQVGHAPVGENPFELGGVFGLSSPQVNEELLGDAGFTSISAGVLPGSMKVADRDDLWDLQSRVAGPVRLAVEAMTADEIDGARTALEPMMAPFASNDGGYDLPTELVVVSAAVE